MAMLIEYLVVWCSFFFNIYCLIKWYRLLVKMWPANRAVAARIVFGILPPLTAISIYVFLMNYAASDVRDAPFYLFFYTMLGITWNTVGIEHLLFAAGFSWRDDTLAADNRAAIAPCAAAYIAFAAIYCGANTGDGPGWWCVVFAGGLGMLLWYIFVYLLQKITNCMEKITVERNMMCGIRIAGLFVAMGVLLGRACGGDWSSFGVTVLELANGWPILVVLFLAVVIEKAFFSEKKTENSADTALYRSVFIAVFYVAMAFSALGLPRFSFAA